METKELLILRLVDCRAKEVLEVERIGGDVSLKIISNSGKVLCESWFEMKKPYKKNFEKIIGYFELIKGRLVQRVLKHE